MRRSVLSQRQLSKNLLLQDQKIRNNGFRLIAGIDEAGRGPLAGPVVAASVILKEFDFSVKIDDSKRLSSGQREKAYKQIIKKAYVSIGIIPEDVVDDINIYQATILAMEKSVIGLDIQPDILLIDGNIKLRLNYTQRGIIKGDKKSLSIACASIVAKVSRDRLLRHYNYIFPGYGFDKHKGYGTKAHIAALKEKGFSPIHRRTFAVRS